MVAHGVPYVDQTTFTRNIKDISEKVPKAIYIPGAAILNIMAPCSLGLAVSQREDDGNHQAGRRDLCMAAV